MLIYSNILPSVCQTLKSMLMTSYLHLNLAYKGKNLTLSTCFVISSIHITFWVNKNFSKETLELVKLKKYCSKDKTDTLPFMTRSLLFIVRYQYQSWVTHQIHKRDHYLDHRYSDTAPNLEYTCCVRDIYLNHAAYTDWHHHSPQPHCLSLLVAVAWTVEFPRAHPDKTSVNQVTARKPQNSW